jgi:hypothetical protein
MNTQVQTPVWSGPRKAGLAGLLLVQFAAAYAIGTGHLMTNDQLNLIAPIAVTAFIPVTLFLSAYALSARFRDFVLSQDMRTLTMMQHWRVLGFTFLTLYAFGALPGLFAWPAGLGDVAIGLAAVVIVARMDRDPDYATSPGFVRFHLLGLLDFAVAIATAGLTAGAFPGLIPNGVTSAPMDVWPLNLFPSFGVPAFIILHLIVLLKVRHLRRAAGNPVNEALRAARTATAGIAFSVRDTCRAVPRFALRGADLMTEATHVAIVGKRRSETIHFSSMLDADVFRRAALVAAFLGSVLTLSNQPSAVFGFEDLQLLPLILVYLTPFIVVVTSQVLGVRPAMADTWHGTNNYPAKETLLGTAFSHCIPARAVLLGLVVGSVNAAIVMGAGLLQHGNLGAVPLALLGQAYSLPVLFGMLSQAIAYRRVARALTSTAYSSTAYSSPSRV